MHGKFSTRGATRQSKWILFSMTGQRHGRRSRPSIDRDTRGSRELRDRDPKRFGGKGVLTAVANVNTLIAPALIGPDASRTGTDRRDHDRTATAHRIRACSARMRFSVSRWRQPVAVGTVARRSRSTRHLSKNHKRSPARPDDERAQRRGARPVAGRRFPGVHDRSFRGSRFPHRTAMGCGDLSCVAGHPEKEKLPDRDRRRGRVCPKGRSNEEPLELITAAIEQAGYPPGRDIGISLDPVIERVLS